MSKNLPSVSVRRSTASLGAALVLFGLVACGGGAQPTLTKAAPDGESLFLGRCAACHGERGGGDGPASASFPGIRNLADPTWQAGVSGEDLAKVIVGGGAAVGLAATMPASPDLADDQAAVDALVAFIRGL